MRLSITNILHLSMELQSNVSVTNLGTYRAMRLLATKGPKELYICQSPISYTYQWTYRAMRLSVTNSLHTNQQTYRAMRLLAINGPTEL